MNLRARSVLVAATLVLAAGLLALDAERGSGPRLPSTPAPQGGQPSAAPSKKPVTGIRQRPAGPTANSSRRARPGITCPARGVRRAVTSGSRHGSIEPYRGLGAWVDAFDYCIAGDLDPVSTIDTLARRGVRTLYLQTGRFREPDDLLYVSKLDAFIDGAALRRINVVGWYVPGFGDIARDVRRSLAVLAHRTPSGNAFSGFAADIETRDEVGGNLLRFNRGIVEYSRRLRSAAGHGAVLGAIVVDAKNNTRAPWRWAGFPWRQIGENFDVIMPMAYWTVTRGHALPACKHPRIDSAAYMREVTLRTTALMTVRRPLHLIGGIGDCLTASELNDFVDSAKALGMIGGSVYDYSTLQSHPNRATIWRALARFNHS